MIHKDYSICKVVIIVTVWWSELGSESEKEYSSSMHVLYYYSIHLDFILRSFYQAINTSISSSKIRNVKSNDHKKSRSNKKCE